MAGLRKEGVFTFQPGWGVFLLRLVLANAAMAMFLISFSGPWEDWTNWEMMSKILQLSVLVVGGMLIYSVVLYGAGIRWRHIHR